jgi:HAE1 family hydrophobic/amphiphilic exporter-1
VALTSPDGRYDSLFMGNYATINLVNELARVPGVGNVAVLGAAQYAMRIWMDPEKLYIHGLTPADVIQVVQAQSQAVTAGQVGTPPAVKGQEFQYTIDVEGRLSDPAQYGNIVVKSDNRNGGRILRLKDVARIELGAQTYNQNVKIDGKPAAGIAIYQSPEANALQVAGAVEKKMAELKKSFPDGLTYVVPFDTTTFVRTSITEVFMTLVEAAVLVLVVIVAFLQDWRAMLVPATTIPVTIIGSFAAMAAMGFTINLSTMFGIVLAIGIVVDDAIVIVEGVTHHIERGMSGHDAAIKAMDELFGPVIGITLVLMSVFLPAAFLPGLTGRMFAQFALVIASTAFLSAVNAATLKPTQCALWLRPSVPLEQRNVFFRGFNAGYARLERGYAWLVEHMVSRSGLMVVIALALAGLGGWGVARLPSAFIPDEDQGYLIVGVQLPDGASLERTTAALDQAGAIAKALPGVKQVTAIAGMSVLNNSALLANAGVAYVVLEDWGVREKDKRKDIRVIATSLQRRLGALQDGSGFVIPPPPISGIGNATGFEMQIEQRDGSFDLAKLQNVAQLVVAEARTQSSIAYPLSPFRAGAPHLRVEVDRSKAESLKVSVGDVFSTLSSYVGSTYVNRFNKFGLSLQVYAQADSQYRAHPEDLLKLQVRSSEGKMIPIGALAKLSPAQGASIISLYNLYPSASVIGLPAEGFSSGQAMDVMADLAGHVLPPGTGYEWTAMSYQQSVVGNQILIVFALAIALVYLCLAGQYESWIAPLSVILAVPLSLIGPALALGAIGLPNNLYTQIGLMLLIALSAKNAILIVEVAREARRTEGKPIAEAALQAAVARLRPILMTSFAFVLGVVPLVTASGAGAVARITLGLCVFSGMIASTVLAVLFVPSFFTVLQQIEERIKKKKPGVLAEAAL